MFPEAVFEERRDFVQQMGLVPSDYLVGNFVALRRILAELENSLALELQVIHGVRRLDVREPGQVDEYTKRFEEYVESRGFSRERTSCHRIHEVYEREILTRERGFLDDDSIQELHNQLAYLASADADFTNEIEPFMDKCLTLLRDIRDASKAGDYERAEQLQDDFRETYRPEVKKLRAAITSLSDAGRSLIEVLGDGAG